MTGFLRKTFGGKDAAEATKQATQTSVDFQEKALDYLKEREAPLQFYQEQGLGGIAQLLGLGTFGEGDGGSADLMTTLEGSPLYRGIMSGLDAGEEAILRNASATGGLRSGNVQTALADHATDLENRALMTAYQDRVGNMKTLAGMPSYAPQIAGATAGIGNTMASGITGAAQAKQDAQGLAMTAIMDGIGKAAQAYSDARLKDNVEQIGQKAGLPYYRWDWNDEAGALGLSGSSEGWMAHEVHDKYPEAVTEHGGYLMVREDLLNG